MALNLLHPCPQEASKVLNGSLLALEADSQAVQATYRAPLVQTLAEAELRRKTPDATARALHVLCWLGCGGSFTPFKTVKGGLLSHSVCPLYHMLRGSSHWLANPGCRAVLRDQGPSCGNGGCVSNMQSIAASLCLNV